MAGSKVSIGVMGIVVVALILLPAIQATAPAAAPAPTSDGTSIDQGIAYILMLVALAITYLIHTAEASF